MIVVGLLGACELTCDVRSGCEAALELPVLAHATPLIAIATESVRSFDNAFMSITSSVTCLCNGCADTFRISSANGERAKSFG